MKKNLKQLIPVFLAIAIVVTISLSLLSCDKKTGGTGGTSGSENVVPGIGTSDSQTPLGTSESGSSSGTVSTLGTLSTTVTSGTPLAPPENIGNYINPLTGLRTQYDASGLKPIAVVVDNINASYAHQTGLAQADIVYETLVSPGISRFTAIISDYSALSAICNIREAYTENIDIIGSHNAVLVAHGGKDESFTSVAAARLGGGWNESLKKHTYGYINTAADVGFTAEGGAKYGTIKYYSKARADAISATLAAGLAAGYYTDGVVRSDLGGENGYDTLLTTEGLMAVLGSSSSCFSLAGGTKAGDAKAFRFVAPDTQKVMNGVSAKNISLTLLAEGSVSKKSVAYAYDASSGKYLRSQDGAAHKDSVTGKQLAFTNVITLFTDVTSAQTKNGVSAATAVTGSGTGYYFYGGEAVEIKWAKSAWNSELVLTDKAGNALELARGTTYIGYLDNSDISAAVSFN